MPIDPSRIRGLCFDVDGTLSDTDDMFVRKLMNWLTPFHSIFPGKDPHPFARRMVMATETPGYFLYGLPDRLGIDDEIDAFGDFVYRLGLGRAVDPFILVQDVREMLEQLAPHYPMSIVSARGRRSTLRFLEQFDLTSYFECIVTGQTCEHTKPYADPILYAAQQMNVPPQACLMIGDSVVDIQAGKAAGTQTVGVLCGFGQENELQRAGADAILSETSNLTKILLNWSG
jgi:phosphoglycolate phosphatase-like HAD superfamily hydrolase